MNKYKKTFVTKKCKECGNQFTTSRHQIYCSKKCSNTRNYKKQKAQYDRMKRGIFLEGEKERYMFYAMRFEILKRDEFRCQYCGATPQEGVVLVIDHIYPKSKGGSNKMDNLITACQICNGGKKDAILEERLIRKLKSR